MNHRELNRSLRLHLNYGGGWQRAQQLITNAQRTKQPHLGVNFNWRAAWCGVHYSPFNKRVCINFVPFITVYYVWKGGLLP